MWQAGGSHGLYIHDRGHYTRHKPVLRSHDIYKKNVARKLSTSQITEKSHIFKRCDTKKGERKEEAKISEYQKESFTPFTYRYSNGRLGHFWLPNTRWRIALEGGWLGITLLGLSG